MLGGLARIVSLQNIHNWRLWKFQIKVILKFSGVWDVIAGTNTCPGELETGADVVAIAAY